MTEPKLTKIAVFEGTTVRKTLFNKEWWFSVVDVCKVLTESPDAGLLGKLKTKIDPRGK